MKYALFNGEKKEAFKNGKGSCPLCEEDVIAKCGNIKIHHWAHKGKRNCDIWWENETEWHREWKNEFPKEWQEVIQVDKNGEKHRADVLNPIKNLTIEFQNSPINIDELRSRECFYEKMIWVINANNLIIEFEDLNTHLNEVESIKDKYLGNKINDQIKVSKDVQRDLIKISDEIKQNWKQGFSEQMIKDILLHFDVEVEKVIASLIYRGSNDSFIISANQLKEEILLPIFNKAINDAKEYARKKKESNIYKYKWIRRRKVWDYAMQPVFLDTGKELLFLKTDQILQKVPKTTFIEKYSQK